MNLRELAELDLAITLEDNDTGFGWSITLTDPAGTTNPDPLYGQSQDIGLLVDPDTGTLVSGKQAACVLRLSSIAAQGLGEPKGVASRSSRPWLVTFNDINGQAFTFKVEYADPDRVLGTINLRLGEWQQ